MTYLRYALWATAAGAFIPVMAVLNARLGRSLGEPTHAAVILFAVGLVTTSAVSLALTGRWPSIATLSANPPINLAGGAIVGFYVISITMLAPRFGVGNAILFVMTAQIFTSATIDHFGLLGTTVRPITTIRLMGIVTLLAGLIISQVADRID